MVVVDGGDRCHGGQECVVVLEEGGPAGSQLVAVFVDVVPVGRSGGDRGGEEPLEHVAGFVERQRAGLVVEAGSGGAELVDGVDEYVEDVGVDRAGGVVEPHCDAVVAQ